MTSFAPHKALKSSASGRLTFEESHSTVWLVLVFKARRLVYHSTLGSREIKKKKRKRSVAGGRFQADLNNDICFNSKHCSDELIAHNDLC